jgi:hypothetical protein
MGFQVPTTLIGTEYFAKICSGYRFIINIYFPNTKAKLKNGATPLKSLIWRSTPI